MKLENMDQDHNQDHIITDYDDVLRPTYNDFLNPKIINNFDLGIYELGLKAYIFFSNLFSENFFIKWKEKRIVKLIQKKNEAARKLKIMKAVRSYKTNMEKFNFDNTSFEKAGESFQKLSIKEVYSRKTYNN